MVVKESAVPPLEFSIDIRLHKVKTLVINREESIAVVDEAGNGCIVVDSCRNSLKRS